jgi:transcriptional regulator with XRE-family HTH domain
MKMTEVSHRIDLNLAEKLQDRSYRQQFFLAEASALIAEKLIALRKRRGLDQAQLAALIGTKQPAISRVEQADYQNWSFNTLRKIADALDARIRVVIEPAEDILREYADEQAAAVSPVMPTLAGANQITTDINAFSASAYLGNASVVPERMNKGVIEYLTNGSASLSGGTFQIAGLNISGLTYRGPSAQVSGANAGPQFTDHWGRLYGNAVLPHAVAEQGMTGAHSMGHMRGVVPAPMLEPDALAI